MNVPRKAAVELILQLECWKRLLINIMLEENNYVKVERPWPRLFDLEKYGSSPLAKSPAMSYWLILIVLQNLPNLFQPLGLLTCRDGVINLRENPSTISSLALLLGLIFQFPTNELAKSSYEWSKTPPNRLRFSYDVQECLRNFIRITHDFSNRGIHGQSFEQFKTFEPSSR